MGGERRRMFRPTSQPKEADAGIRQRGNLRLRAADLEAFVEILSSEAETVWLDPTISKEHALSLLEPYPADLMLALPASTRANSTRNDDSGLLLSDDALAA